MQVKKSQSTVKNGLQLKTETGGEDLQLKLKGVVRELLELKEN